MLTLEIASILTSHQDSSYDLHEDPDFVVIVVHEEVVVSSKLFMSCKSMINFSSLRLDNSIQFLDTSPIRIGLTFVSLNLGSKISENLLFLSFKENPDCFGFHFATWFFLCCTNLTNLVRARVSPVLECAKNE